MTAVYQRLRPFALLVTTVPVGEMYVFLNLLLPVLRLLLSQRQFLRQQLHPQPVLLSPNPQVEVLEMYLDQPLAELERQVRIYGDLSSLGLAKHLDRMGILPEPINILICSEV